MVFLMDNNDLEKAIETVRNALFNEHENFAFESILNRLEGYEIAYKTILGSNKRFEEDVQIKEKHLEKIGKSNREYLQAFEETMKENEAMKQYIRNGLEFGYIDDREGDYKKYINERFDQITQHIEKFE